jgi:hypothetical protein
MLTAAEAYAQRAAAGATLQRAKDVAVAEAAGQQDAAGGLLAWANDQTRAFQQIWLDSNSPGTVNTLQREGTVTMSEAENTTLQREGTVTMSEADDAMDVVDQEVKLMNDSY